MAHVETGNVHLGSSILHHTEALEINSLEKAVRNTHRQAPHKNTCNCDLTFCQLKLYKKK